MKIKNSCMRFALLLFPLLSGSWAAAQTVPLENLTSDQFKSVMGDLSAAFMHTSVSGAAGLGHLWGFEIGVVASQTSTPNLQAVANQAASGGDVDASKVPSASVLGRLSLPVGLSAEFSILPKVSSGSFQASDYAFAAKWTPTEVFGDLPLDLALRLSMTKTDLNFSGTVNNVATTYEYKSTITALEAVVSKNFVLFEPYASFGVVKVDGSLNADGATDVFAMSFSESSSASDSRTGTVFRVGTEIKLFFARLGLEYADAFSAKRFSGKLSVAF